MTKENIKKDNFELRKNENYYLISKRALPEIILKVLETKKLIIEKNISVAQATKETGISRTSFYKYANDIFDITKSNTKKITLAFTTKNKVGILSEITNIISQNNFNILTINQSSPVDDKCILTISVESTNLSTNIETLLSQFENNKKILSVKILSMED